MLAIRSDAEFWQVFDYQSRQDSRRNDESNEKDSELLENISNHKTANVTLNFEKKNMICQND